MRSYPGPLARIARFARADWYAELRARLQNAASRMRFRIKEGGAEPGPSRDWRYFANSRLPERRLALEAGLGMLGRHGLVMVPGHGSAVVLGILLLPASVIVPPGFAQEPPQSGPPSASCAVCEACEEACPTGALSPKRGFVRELCLQHWSSLPGALPPAVEAVWGDRLYGCDLCQEACPLFEPDASAETSRGRLGPGLPAAWLAAAPEGEIRTALKGSVLGMRWIAIEALRRSAALVLRGLDGSRGGLGTYRDI